MSEWISVKDRLPEPSYDEYGSPEWDVVLVWDKYRIPSQVSLGHYINRKSINEWRLEGGNFDASPYITHWMPLPDPPKESE